MRHILLLDGESRQTLTFLKELKQMGYNLSLVCSSKKDLCFWSRWSDKKYILPDPNRFPKQYFNAIQQLVSTNRFDLVIPFLDTSAEIMSKHKSALEKYVKIAVNNWDIFKKARNKETTMEECKINSIPCPVTYTQSFIKEMCETSVLSFPLLIKPKIGFAGRGMRIVNSKKELKSVLGLIGKSSQVIIQEYVPPYGKQYQVEIFLNNCQSLVSSVVYEKVRWYPFIGGSSTSNVTVQRSDVLEICYKFLKSLKWIGYAHLDLIEDPRDMRIKVLEINPRINGATKICSIAGVKFSRIITDFYLFNRESKTFHYKIGVRLGFLHKDLLWLLSAKRSLKMIVSWIKSQSTDMIFDINDPLPFFIYSLSCINAFYIDTRSSTKLKDPYLKNIEKKTLENF